MKSTMFLSNITAVDHAYIDNRGMIMGGSVNPTMRVSGEIDEAEKVVVDFSTVKKDIKHIIDAKYSGFDHKLWIIEGYSECVVVEDGSRNLKVETPYLIISAPRDAFKIISTVFNGDYLNSVAEQMQHELIAELNMMHPKSNIMVDLEFDTSFWGNALMNTPMIPFRYTHGLKGSTSWGCQNIAHGHLSYLAATTSKPVETEMLLQSIAADIDGTIFVWNENIVSANDNMIQVSYETDRGSFDMKIANEYAESSVIGVNTETTVEFLAEAIANQYRDSLREAGVSELFVSEGLNKGAVASI